MDLPPVEGPVIVNTTIILIDIFEVLIVSTVIASIAIDQRKLNVTKLPKVHPETFTLDLSLYIKLMWRDNRIQLANGLACKLCFECIGK